MTDWPACLPATHAHEQTEILTSFPPPPPSSSSSKIWTATAESNFYLFFASHTLKLTLFYSEIKLVFAKSNKLEKNTLIQLCKFEYLFKKQAENQYNAMQNLVL